MNLASPALHLRLPMPRQVLAIGLARETIKMLKAVVGTNNVMQFQEAQLLEEYIISHAEVCVVVAIPSDAHPGLSDAIVSVRERFPRVPMIAIFFPTASSCQAILRLGAAGVSQIVTGEPVVRSSDLTTALSNSQAEGVAIRIWRHCRLSVPEPLKPVLKAAIRIAHTPITNGALSDATRMHERSLRKYCAFHVLPSPQWIIGWARLLVAGFYLDEPGRTVAQVADLLDFPSTCALRNQLKRYSALSSRSLRAQGSSVTIARRLEEAVEAHRRYKSLETAQTVLTSTCH